MKRRGFFGSLAAMAIAPSVAKELVYEDVKPAPLDAKPQTGGTAEYCPPPEWNTWVTVYAPVDTFRPRYEWIRDDLK